MNTTFHSQIQVQALKDGWIKRTYQFMSNGEVLAQLQKEKSYCGAMKANLGGKDFLIKRRGLWKHFVEIQSSFEPYNMRLDLNWRNKLKVTDSAGNPYVFKSTGFWHTKWQWVDRYQRPVIEIKSRNFSARNRGLIEIKDHDMKEPLFWIVVSWFVILCSESDAAIAAAT